MPNANVVIQINAVYFDSAAEAGKLQHNTNLISNINFKNRVCPKTTYEKSVVAIVKYIACFERTLVVLGFVFFLFLFFFNFQAFCK